MTESELAEVRRELMAEHERAEQAELRQREAERQACELRRLLTRYHTSLAEQFNDPARA